MSLTPKNTQSGGESSNSASGDSGGIWIIVDIIIAVEAFVGSSKVGSAINNVVPSTTMHGELLILVGLFWSSLSNSQVPVSNDMEFLTKKIPSPPDVPSPLSSL